MNDRPASVSSLAEPVASDIEAATRRLMQALDALESAVERRRDADRDEDELASRIQALGADRSRLADELDGALVKSRRLERVNREIAERLDGAIETIRTVLGVAENGANGQDHNNNHDHDHDNGHDGDHDDEGDDDGEDDEAGEDE